MGKGTISSDDGEGLYTVNFDYGNDVQAANITALDEEIARLTSLIAEVQTILDAFEPEIAFRSQQLDDAIDAYNADRSDENLAAVTAATQSLLETTNAKFNTETAQNNLKLTLASTENRREYMAALEVTETKQVWCVDYTEQATGLVSTIEINGQPPLTLIAPTAPAYTYDYGRMHSDVLISYAATYYNAATLPGWQKYKPTYRIGVITYISRENNICDVDLDQALSDAQGLDINQVDRILNIPFEYMTCNHAAFTVGDEVVIKFENQNWDSPKVIGFKQEPKQCAPSRIMFFCDYLTAAATGYSTSISGWEGNEDYNTTTNHTEWNGYIDKPIYQTNEQADTTYLGSIDNSYSPPRATGELISIFNDREANGWPGVTHEFTPTQSKIRLRFDVYWLQTSENGLFDIAGSPENLAYEIGDISCANQTNTFGHACDTKLGIEYNIDKFGDAIWYDSAFSLTSGTVVTYYLDGALNQIFNSEEPTVNMVAPNERNRISVSDYIWQDQSFYDTWGPVPPSYSNTRLQEVHDFPASVTVEVHGEEVVYVLDTVGVPSLCKRDGFNNFKEQTVPAVTPPGRYPGWTGEQTTDRDFAFPGFVAAIYIREDLA